MHDVPEVQVIGKQRERASKDQRRPDELTSHLHEVESEHHQGEGEDERLLRVPKSVEMCCFCTQDAHLVVDLCHLLVIESLACCES